MPFGDGSPIRPTPAWLHLIRLGCAPSPPPASALCSSPHSRPGSAAPRLLARGAFASLQRVGEASLGGPGPQGLLLIGMRRPAGQGEDLERGGDAPVRPGEMLGVDLAGAHAH